MSNPQKVVGLLLIVIISLLASCAQQGNPSGGPPDKTPPVIVDTIPLQKTLNFEGKEVVLKFDEYVKVPTYGQDLFISPLLPEPPKVSMSGKKIKVAFQEKLLENTTYVLSFTEIKDLNASNKMNAFTLAFSTGDAIDSMEVKGRVEGTTKGKGVEDITLLLFDADSAIGNDFYGKKPAYITKSNKDGTFTLPYLRHTAYRIYGIEDIDKSSTYNLPTEVLALADTPLIRFSDTTNTVEVTLLRFIPDARAPAINGYNWLSDSVLRITFNEGIVSDSLNLVMRDTLGQDTFPISIATYIDRQLLIKSPFPRDSFSVLSFLNLRDSLGNASDSLLLVRPRRARKPDMFPLFHQKPTWTVDSNAYTWMMPVPIQASDTAFVSLVDTAGRALPTSLHFDGFEIWLSPDTVLDPLISYEVHISGEMVGEIDTVFRYPIQTFVKEDFGTFSGTVKVLGYEGPFVVYFKGKEEYVIRDSVFNLQRVAPGTYKVSVLLDLDGNGILTPGSLSPYRLPERMVESSETFSIRANWDFEEQAIVIDPNAKVAAPSGPSAGPAAGGPPNDNAPKPFRRGN